MAASGRKWPHVAARGRLDLKFPKQRHLHHLQPLAGSCSHLQPLLQPLAATCSHSSGRKWPLGQVAASGRKWPHVAARGRTWPVALLVGFEISRAASLAAICIICSHLQPLAATCSHSSGRKWPHVAAWTANTSPNGPTLENLKKKCVSGKLHFLKFSVKREVRVETKGKK